MADPLRVAFFAGSYDHIVDGVTLSTNRQVAHLVNRGVPVRVYAPSNGKPVLDAAGEFLRVPSFSIPRTDYAFALSLPRANLEAFDPALVHLATPDWLGARALRWAKRRSLPVVATYHTHFTSYLKHYRCGLLEGFCWRLLRRFYSQCDEVLVPCRSIGDELRSRGITAPITVNSYGVDTRNFSPAFRSLDWRRQHGIADGEVIVTFVGRLVWEKGLECFTRTLHKLDERFVHYRVLIVGEGPARNAFRERLPKAIFTGRLGGAELATAFASSDVFFFPSASETFGCVTVEALASGLPCVVADATGSRDIVRHGVEGFLAPAEDSEVFAFLLAALIRDRSLRARMRGPALQRAAAFGWPGVLATMEERFRVRANVPQLALRIAA